MKPYLGILIDSFWETVNSKVLWALLGLSTLILLALCPFGLISERSFIFANYDINTAEKTRLYEKLAGGLDGKVTPAIQAIAKKLDPKFQERVKKAASDSKSKEDIRTNELVDELNRLLKDKTLFEPGVFARIEKQEKYLQLIEKLPDQISEDELIELNRRLLNASFTVELDPPSGEQVWLAYGTFRLKLIPFSRKQISLFLEPLVLQSALKVGLAVLINFIAIIMTSWIIPETFRSGSLHMMLSKPISRTLLFLSKFLGGCIFVTFNLVYIVVGLYLIAGLRFELWNHGLLACIPLLLFVFIIFYSISALVGLFWGNAIVSIVACILFWAMFVAIDLTRNAMNEIVMRPQTINRVVEIEGKLFAVNQSGQLKVWSAEAKLWQPATEFVVNFGQQALTFGPVWDSKHELIVSKSFRMSEPFERFGNANNRNLELIKIDKTRQSKDSVKSANPAASTEAPAEPTIEPNVEQAVDIETLRRTSYWVTDEGPALPRQVSGILKVGSEIVVVSRSGLYLLDLDKKVNESEKSDAINNWIKSKVGGNDDKDGPFQRASPEEFVLADNFALAAIHGGEGVVTYANGTVQLLNLRDKQFVIEVEETLEGDKTDAAMVAANGTYCLVAREEAPIELLDANLKPVGQIELANMQSPKQWTWIPGVQNQIALVTQEGALLRIDCQKQTVEPIRLPTGERVTCVSWKNETEAFVGLAPNRVQLINVKDGVVVNDYRSPARTSEWIYSWIINPLYTIAPKPGAMDDTMSYLLTGKSTEVDFAAMGNSKRELSIWGPIACNAIYVFILLGIGCIYVSRKEY